MFLYGNKTSFQQVLLLAIYRIIIETRIEASNALCLLLYSTEQRYSIAQRHKTIMKTV